MLTVKTLCGLTTLRVDLRARPSMTVGEVKAALCRKTRWSPAWVRLVGHGRELGGGDDTLPLYDTLPLGALPSVVAALAGEECTVTAPFAVLQPTLPPAPAQALPSPPRSHSGPPPPPPSSHSTARPAHTAAVVVHAVLRADHHNAEQSRRQWAVTCKDMTPRGQGRKFTVTVSSDERIGELKRRLANVYGCAAGADEQRLVFAGRTLSDAHVAGEYGFSMHASSRATVVAAAAAAAVAEGKREEEGVGVGVGVGAGVGMGADVVKCSKVMAIMYQPDPHKEIDVSMELPNRGRIKTFVRRSATVAELKVRVLRVRERGGGTSTPWYCRRAFEG